MFRLRNKKCSETGPNRRCSETVPVRSLVLIAHAAFLLERRQTDATERPTHAGGYTAGVGNKHISIALEQ